VEIAVDGKTLDQWNVTPSLAKVWQVVDGAIKSDAKGGGADAKGGVRFSIAPELRCQFRESLLEHYPAAAFGVGLDRAVDDLPDLREGRRHVPLIQRLAVKQQFPPVLRLLAAQCVRLTT